MLVNVTARDFWENWYIIQKNFFCYKKWSFYYCLCCNCLSAVKAWRISWLGIYLQKWILLSLVIQSRVQFLGRRSFEKVDNCAASLQLTFVFNLRAFTDPRLRTPPCFHVSKWGLGSNEVFPAWDVLESGGSLVNSYLLGNKSGQEHVSISISSKFPGFGDIAGVGVRSVTRTVMLSGEVEKVNRKCS